MVGWLVVSAGTARGARWGRGEFSKNAFYQQRTSLESSKKNQNKAVINQRKGFGKNSFHIIYIIHIILSSIIKLIQDMTHNLKGVALQAFIKLYFQYF
jgi:hypothetical protein